MTLTVGSLFSGIGGLEFGLERAGLGPVLWQVEIDPFCRQVLAAHWPNAERFDDVRSVGVDCLAPVDIICGGFPCQGASLAGKGLGLADPRTGLWREYARLVRELRPRFVVAENVPGLIRRGLDVVVADLADAGYAVEAARIAARDVGAPHRRERIFVVAHSECERIRLEQQRLPARRPGDVRDEGQAEPVDDGAGMADADCPGQQRSRSTKPARRVNHVLSAGQRCEWPPPPGDLHAWGQVPADAQPSVCRLADGIPTRLAGGRRKAQLKALGNAVVPACAEIVGRRVLELHAKGPTP